MSLPDDIYSQRILDLAANIPRTQRLFRPDATALARFQALRQSSHDLRFDAGQCGDRLWAKREGLPLGPDLGGGDGARDRGLDRGRASRRWRPNAEMLKDADLRAGVRQQHRRRLARGLRAGHVREREHLRAALARHPQRADRVGRLARLRDPEHEVAARQRPGRGGATRTRCRPRRARLPARDDRPVVRRLPRPLPQHRRRAPDVLRVQPDDLGHPGPATTRSSRSGRRRAG